MSLTRVDRQTFFHLISSINTLGEVGKRLSTEVGQVLSSNPLPLFGSLTLSTSLVGLFSMRTVSRPLPFKAASLFILGVGLFLSACQDEEEPGPVPPCSGVATPPITRAEIYITGIPCESGTAVLSHSTLNPGEIYGMCKGGSFFWVSEGEGHPTLKQAELEDRVLDANGDGSPDFTMTGMVEVGDQQYVTALTPTEYSAHWEMMVQFDQEGHVQAEIGLPLVFVLHPVELADGGYFNVNVFLGGIRLLAYDPTAERLFAATENHFQIEGYEGYVNATVLTYERDNAGKFRPQHATLPSLYSRPLSMVQGGRDKDQFVLMTEGYGRWVQPHVETFRQRDDGLWEREDAIGIETLRPKLAGRPIEEVPALVVSIDGSQLFYSEGGPWLSDEAKRNYNNLGAYLYKVDLNSPIHKTHGRFPSTVPRPYSMVTGLYPRTELIAGTLAVDHGGQVYVSDSRYPLTVVYNVNWDRNNSSMCVERIISHDEACVSSDASGAIKIGAEGCEGHMGRAFVEGEYFYQSVGDLLTRTPLRK